MERAFWDNTFKSRLCGAFWLTREDAAAPDLGARLNAEWPAFRDELVARAQRWKDEVEYESITVGPV